MESKHKGFNIVIVILSLLVASLVGFIIYDKFLSNNIEDENNCQDNSIPIIPTSDLVTLFYEANNKHVNILYAYLENGFLYYHYDSVFADGLNKAEDGITETAFDFISTFYIDTEGKTDIKKYEGLENIKRIKTYNIGTGVNPTPYLITESGKVYILLLSDGELKITLDERFKDYQVENILSHKEKMNDTFEILLKDGTTKIIN